MTSDAEIIRGKVRAAFKADVGDDFVLQFLAELRTNMRDAEKGTRRATGLIVVLAVVFELANRGAVAEASQGLDLFAIPVADPFGQALRDVRFRQRNAFLVVAAWLRFPLFVMIPPVGGTAFEFYAFVQLFLRKNISDAVVVTAALITFGILALATARVVTEAPHGGGPWRAQ